MATKKKKKDIDVDMCMSDGSTLETEKALLEVQQPPIPPVEPVKDPGIVKRINPNQLYQPFWNKINILLQNCEARGVRYFATSGLRSYEDQAAIYAQGRTKPGKIVSWAKPGHSYHNFGLAVDFCSDKDLDQLGLQPDWNIASYKILAEEAKKLGLEAGFWWTKQDAPHVQLAISRHGLSTEDLRSLYAKGGMSAVYHLLNHYQW